MKPVLSLLIIALTAVWSASAQLVMWGLAPAGYKQVEYLGFEMFKVVGPDGQASIVDGKGQTLLEGTAFDTVTPFYDHWALLLSNQSSNKQRIVGCISTDKVCNAFPAENEYYTIEGQTFYSCGLLSVENRSGKKGYIDEEGELVIGFSSGFDKVMPFSEDYAAVFKNGRFLLIDKFGESVTMVLPRVGEIRGGTNVYNGKAIVWDGSGHYYDYDVQTKSCSKRGKPSKNATPDYLYRMTDKGDTPPYMAADGRKGLSPTASHGKYGYTSPEGKVLVPCQLTAASQFVDGYAIVKTGKGETGILWLDEHPASGFNIRPVNPSIKYTAGETVTCSFTVTPPANWPQQDINASIDGLHVTTADQGKTFSFKYAPTDQSKTFTVNILSHGLTLHASTLSFNFSKKEGKAASSSGKAKGKDKDKKEPSGKKDSSRGSKKSSGKQQSREKETPKPKRL